jgi:hypothetical protein
MNSIVLIGAMLLSIAEAKQHPFKSLMMEQFKNVVDMAKLNMDQNNLTYTPSEFPYWNFMPQYRASVLSETPGVWSSKCE